MYCVRKVLEDLWWVGGNDRRLAMFEGVYAVPNGVSYNSYLLLDDKTVLFDTVDPSVSKVFFENVDHVLAGRKLDYLVIHHMEPDHSGTVSEVLLRHPETVIVCSDRIRAMLQQFRGGVAPQNAFHLVKEGDTFETGHHTLTFLSAPMVHWPEVMVSYDLTTRTLFSADAFGTFGAINGALFALVCRLTRQRQRLMHGLRVCHPLALLRHGNAIIIPDSGRFVKLCAKIGIFWKKFCRNLSC